MVWIISFLLTIRHPNSKSESSKTVTRCYYLVIFYSDTKHSSFKRNHYSIEHIALL